MNKRKIIAIIAGLTMAICLASCGDSEESGRDAGSTPDAANSSSVSAAQPTESSDDVSAPDDASQPDFEYDPNGDVRLYDKLYEQYAGNYKLTGNLSVNDGDSYSVVYEVKGDLRYLSATVMGMQTKRYITAEGDMYVVNDATTTYEKYNHDELGNMVLKSPQYDPLFAATGSFVKAENAEDGGFKEEYALDYEGIEGSIIYSFDKTGSLTGVAIQSDDMDNELVSDTVITPAVDDDFVLPELSEYRLNN